MNWEQRLEFHEGLRLKPYRCTAGKLTIGVGHNIESRDWTEEEKRAIGDWKNGITKNAAYMILRNDINLCLDKLKTLGYWYYLDEERQYALLDLCFQLGWSGLNKFRKMLEAFRTKNWSEAERQCLDSNYAKQCPKRANRIAKLIKYGRWEI
jgi:lysozyme